TIARLPASSRSMPSSAAPSDRAARARPRTVPRRRSRVQAGAGSGRPTTPTPPMTRQATLRGHSERSAAVGDTHEGATSGRGAERLAQRRGLSFAIAEADSDRAVGQIGLWLAELPHGRAAAGYGIAPSARGRGVAAAALVALTRFAWTISGVHRIELHIEPWN